MSDSQPVADSTASHSSPPLSPPMPTGSGTTPPGNGSFFQNKAMQPYLMGGVIVALFLFLAYQQTQISHLTSELSSVTDSVKSSDVKTRLESQEHSLDELNTRLAYLDSKINATDQKAQNALSRIKAHEDNDVIGNMIKSVKQSLGIH